MPFFIVKYFDYIFTFFRQPEKIKFIFCRQEIATPFFRRLAMTVMIFRQPEK
ncbi:MAG: hypothetical protein IKG79_00790 [Neisseriaceae bacterium]|nr:hypothetical protein [Neisseriaceae bacterium]